MSNYLHLIKKKPKKIEGFSYEYNSRQVRQNNYEGIKKSLRLYLHKHKIELN